MFHFEHDAPCEQHDVLVIGSGLAGMSAAFSAREKGANVTLIDKASEASRSGNTRFSGGALRCPTKENTVDMLVDELVRMTNGRADTALGRTLYRTAADDVEWLRALGAPIGSPATERPDLRGGRMSYHVQGNGYGLVEAIYPQLARRGVNVRFETKATNLLVDASGRVAGVRARSRRGYTDLLASNVILA